MHRFADSYNTPDKNKQTPITIVLAEWERQKFFATIKGDKIKPEVKKGAPAVIAEILSKIPEADERISAIKQNYHGMTAVEYDIKSRNGVIVEVKRCGRYAYTYVATTFMLHTLGYF